MKALRYLFILLLATYITSFGQNDGGMLCGGEDEKPRWLFRIEVIDRDTHLPIRNAQIKNMDNEGRSMTWQANSRGIAVLVVTTPYCLPEQGTLEIAAEGYRYHSEPIERSYFEDNESKYRILMEGHRHQWVDMNRIPETQEIIDKVSARRYELGVRVFPSGLGFNWVNYAPPCFEFEIELERLENQGSNDRPHGRGSRSEHQPRGDSNPVPKVLHNGRFLYVFPNDLSSGPYFWQKAKDGCDCLNRLGFSDWRLPTKDELNTLFINRDQLGGFTQGWYWSSSASSGNRYWIQSFEDGYQETEAKSTSYNIHKGGLRVRCVRSE
jgi:hypothetical protein